MHAAPTAELWLPDTPAIDWTSFETASEAGADILARLAGDRSLLRRLVFKGPSRDEFWSRTAASDDGGFISLHDDRQRGIHLFLHLGTQHHQGETCEQRYSYVCRVIAGAYPHSWHRGGEGKPTFVTREQPPGMYSVLAGVTHSPSWWRARHHLCHSRTRPHRARRTSARSTCHDTKRSAITPIAWESSRRWASSMI
jgi:hypothetical protein